MKMELRFPINGILYLTLGLCVFCDKAEKWQLQRRWVSANFGSTLASPPVLADFNRDGHLDAVILSFDGELILLDATSHGEPLQGTDWPAYHHGHHFYAAPILTDLDHDGINEIIISSFDGIIFVYSWKGVLLKSTKLPRFNIKKNLLLASETELLKILNTAALEKSEATVELRPEIYSSPLLVDLNNDGRVEELVFALNYGVIQTNGTDKTFNFLLGAGLVFNVTSFKVITHKFTDSAKRQSEFPPYFLSDPVWFTPPKKVPLVAAASTRGHLHVWKGLKLESLPKFPYAYGPSTQTPTIIWPQGEPILVLLEHSGNILALDLKARDVWEAKAKGTPTAARRWVVGDKEAIVLGTDRGLIYALDTQTGKPLAEYPVTQTGLRFAAPPLLTSLSDSEAVAFMAQDSDALVVTDLHHPNQSHIVSFLGEKSFLGPSLLPYKLRDGCSILLPFADGAVGCFTPQTLFTSGSSSVHRVVELLPYLPLSIYIGADFRHGGVGSTLLVYGETCTLVLHISDHRPSHQYNLKVFLSGSLVHTDELTRNGFHHISFHLLPTDDHGLLMVEVQSQLCGSTARDSLWLQRATFLDRQAVTLKVLAGLACLMCVVVAGYRKRSAVAALFLELRIYFSHLSLRWRRRLLRLEDPVLPLHQPLPASPASSSSFSWSLLRPLRFLRELILKCIRAISVRFRREQRHRLY